ncbi:MAG: hypothetical protein J7L25_00465, partial [Deltaproteobacteria bacterium]|nr:hypothetical protein [Candidatus Tharpella aukensis]
LGGCPRTNFHLKATTTSCVFNFRETQDVVVNFLIFPFSDRLLVHTNAVKEHLIPDDLSKSKQRFVYANEADLLNLALFNKTAASWRKEHPNEKGNIRDTATIEQLVVLSNLESFNSELISEGIDSETRLQKLNQIAIRQMRIMIENRSLKKLEGK